jgi:hypothetical protein
MFELMLCSLFTLVPDYPYRRYAQGKRSEQEMRPCATFVRRRHP